MLEFRNVTFVKWSLAASIVLSACSAPWEPDGVELGVLNDDDLGAWTPYTSEEYPASSCPDGQAVSGVDCEGNFCDNIALYCAATDWPSGSSTWLPYFSEEGTGGADEGRCTSDDMWMTGIGCKDGFCDRIRMQCTQLLGSSTGDCMWSGWRSEEQAPFYAPVDTYIKGIECAGPFCDDKRYRYCQMH